MSSDLYLAVGWQQLVIVRLELHHISWPLDGMGWSYDKCRVKRREMVPL